MRNVHQNKIYVATLHTACKSISTPLSIVYTDLYGQMEISLKGEHIYFVRFTDEISRWTDVDLLRNKYKVVDKLEHN